MWDEFFPKCGLLEEQIDRIKTTLLEQAQDKGTIYDIDEIIADSPGWMEQHDRMFPEYKLTESEKMEILRVAVKTVQEEVAEKSKWLYQIQV
jgi:predicted metal-dependent peptidase